MIRKDVIIAILATFCLINTLFLVLPTRSSPGVGEYDSWADINDDGKTNMYDIGYTAQKFGATGDATKNVNVTDWPPQYAIQDFSRNYSWTNGGSRLMPTLDEVAISTEGYNRMFVLVEPRGMSPGFYNITVYLREIAWYLYPGTPSDTRPWFGSNTVESANITIWKNDMGTGPASYQGMLYTTTETKCLYFRLSLSAASTADSGWVKFEVYVYFRND